MKKIIKKIITMTLALSLLTPGVTRAEEDRKMETISLPVILEKDENTYNPDIIYNYTASQTSEERADSGVIVNQFKEDLLVIDNPKIKFSQEGETIQKLKLSIKNDLSQVKPGIYRYALSQKNQEEDLNGLTSSSQTYIIDVYVVNDGTAKKSFMLAYPEGSEGDKKISPGENEGELNFKNIYQTSFLQLSKKLVGNAADMNKKFDFTIELKDSNGNNTFSYIANSGELTYINGEDSATIKIQLGHEDSIKIFGLSDQDSYKISENKENYESDYHQEKEASIEKNTSLVITNSLNQEIPTGVIENMAPFIVLLLGVLAFAFIYFKKNRYEA